MNSIILLLALYTGDPKAGWAENKNKVYDHFVSLTQPLQLAPDGYDQTQFAETVSHCLVDFLAQKYTYEEYLTEDYHKYFGENGIYSICVGVSYLSKSKANEPGIEEFLLNDKQKD